MGRWRGVEARHHRRFDASHDPRDEPYCMIACKIYGVPDGTLTKNSPEREVGKTCDLAFGYAGGLGPGANFEPDRFTEKKSRCSRTSGARRIRDRALLEQHRQRRHEGRLYPGVEFVCGPVVLKSDGKFLRIRLPSGRDLCYPNPRLIVDDPQAHEGGPDVDRQMAVVPDRKRGEGHAGEDRADRRRQLRPV